MIVYPSTLGSALGMAVIVGTVVLAGCAPTPPPVTRTTTTTEEITTTPPPPVQPMQSTTTTETQEFHRP